MIAYISYTFQCVYVADGSLSRPQHSQTLMANRSWWPTVWRYERIWQCFMKTRFPQRKSTLTRIDLLARIQHDSTPKILFLNLDSEWSCATNASRRYQVGDCFLSSCWTAQELSTWKRVVGDCINLYEGETAMTGIFLLKMVPSI